MGMTASISLARLSEHSSHGGMIITASGNSILANGIAVAVDGDLHSCPIPGHGITSITSSSKNTCGGKGLIKAGDVAGCGAVITTGSMDVLTV
jgi:uncharacterized Zn-binding protein involved in type VI secretion